jgi:hypothetical protein
LKGAEEKETGTETGTFISLHPAKPDQTTMATTFIARTSNLTNAAEES